MSNTYGEWLKTQREAARLTQQELADRAIMTRSHISHIEAGRRTPSPDDAKRLDAALGTGNVLSSFLPKREGEIADYFEAARQLEQQATMIREYALSYFPGILQTEAYMRAVYNSAFPPKSETERDKLTIARLDRGKILDAPVTPVVWALLDESLFRRPVGGPEVMAEQIMHVVRLTECGRVRTHVMPFGVGSYPLMRSLLTLMWFEDQPPCAYTEGQDIGMLHDSPTVVHRLQSCYDVALADALSLRESLAFMRQVAKDYGHHG